MIKSRKKLLEEVMFLPENKRWDLLDEEFISINELKDLLDGWYISNKQVEVTINTLKHRLGLEKKKVKE